MGAEPISPCTQFEDLADLLRNRVNSQRNPSLYEVWRQKIKDDIEKQMVRRLHWDGKVAGICMRTKAAMPPAWHLPQDPWRSQITSSLPYQSREGSTAPGGTWVLEVPGGNTDEVGDTQRCCSPAGTVDAA